MGHPSHNELGRELGIFATDEMIGTGLPMWLPAGAVIRHEIERFVVDLERRAGYQHVYTPPLGKRALYERSGHMALYAENIYPPIDLDGEQLVLRPMNCPHHIRAFQTREHSYRELPVRLAELGTMFRNELSGAVGGLSRVRCMTLNDGHVFCAVDQIAGEVAAMLGLIDVAYAAFGIRAHRYRLSLRGEGGKYVDDDAMWEGSETVLRAALDAAGVAYEDAPGEAAFYGPKLDVQVLDSRGREETLSTVQVDFHAPRQFDITYVAAGGGRERPVLLHRSITSTVERLVAHLLETHGPALPVWLAPVQVVVLPQPCGPSASADWAHEIEGELRDAGVRTAVDNSDDTLSRRVRRAAEQHVPYVAVVGGREVATRGVSVRGPGNDQLGAMSVGDLVARIDSARPA